MKLITELQAADADLEQLYDVRALVESVCGFTAAGPRPVKLVGYSLTSDDGRQAELLGSPHQGAIVAPAES